MRLSSTDGGHSASRCYHPSIPGNTRKQGRGTFGFSPLFLRGRGVKGLAAVCCIWVLATGCSQPDVTGNSAVTHTRGIVVELPSKRSVECVMSRDGYGLGISCDWGNAR